MIKRNCEGYEIIEAEQYRGNDIYNAKAEIVIGHNENNPVCPYVVWHCYKESDYFWGHYITNWWEALEDYHNTLAQEYERLAAEHKRQARAIKKQYAGKDGTYNG